MSGYTNFVTKVGRSSLRIFLILVMWSSPAAVAQENFVASARTCSPDEVGQWRFVREHRLGVRTSPVREWIDMFPAEQRPRYPKNIWFPQDGYSHDACGTLSDYGESSGYTGDSWTNFFLGGGSDDDWTMNIIPGERDRYLLEDSVPFLLPGLLDALTMPILAARRNVLLDCPPNSGLNNCLHVEIDPPRGVRNKVWGPGKLSPVKDQPVCVHGPWVRDCDHGCWPEIHPTERIWWRHSVPGFEQFILMLIQDASGRFEHRSNFDFGEALADEPPQGWKPWADGPRRATFKVAFEHDSATNPQPVVFAIDEFVATHVVTEQDLRKMK